MDEGDIFCQEETPIKPEETSSELEKRLAIIGADLLVTTLQNIDNITPRPQDHSLATLAPLIKKQDGKIDWANEAIRIERKIKAFTPWPSSYAYLQNSRIKILKGNRQEREDGQHKPGEILKIDKQGIEVGCGQNTVFRIEILQPENKKPMDAYSYSLGARLEKGMVFS
jgi:methionyl-tRNA formyltransferase